MKKLYVLLAMVCVSSFTFAQKEIGNVIKFPKHEFSISKTPTDTLAPGNYNNATSVVLITAPGGYMLGCNSYGDYCKAEQFIVTPSTSYKIEGAIYWVGAKEIVGSPNTVDFTVWNMDGTTGTTTAGANQTCPNTVLGFVTTPVDQVDTSLSFSGAHVVTFTSPITVTSDYAIGVNLENTYDDTIGMVSSADGDGGGMELCWEKWSSDGKWYTLQGGGWGGGATDVDMAVFPIVDASSANINDDYFVFGMKMSTYPNPARNETTVTYELEKDAANVTVKILNETGKLVRTIEQGAQDKGVHTLNLDLAGFANGSYYCNLSANGQKLVKRFMVVK